MPSPNTTFTEMVTTTLRKHGTSLADNVTNHNALLNRMKKKGNIEKADGGYEIVEPLEYAENSTFQRFSGYDTLNVQASDVMSAAKFDWKNAAVHVTASGEELRKNSGKNAMIKLVKSRIKNAFNTANNNMSGDVYSDGTATNQINGIQALVADAGTGTVGGINSSTYSFWQNGVQSAAAPIQGGGAITPSKTTIQSLMLPLWLQLTRGMDHPDLIVADNTYFTFYEESLTDLKRYTEDGQGTGGFVSLKYKTADVVFDSSASGMPSAHMYFLNTDYLKMVCHKDANWTQIEDQRPVNQDAAVTPLLWMGNMCLSNRSLQGVLKA